MWVRPRSCSTILQYGSYTCEYFKISQQLLETITTSTITVPFPIHHEGLQQEVPPVLDLELEATHDLNPESSSLSSVSSNFEGDEGKGRLSQPQVANEIRRGLKLSLEILRVGVSKVARIVWNYATCARGFWSIASVTGVAAMVVLSFLYVRV